MKQPEESNAEIGLEQQNYIIKAYRDLKDSIFNVLFVILDKNDDETTIYSVVFESGVDFMQMLAFPFDSSIISVWNGGTALDSISEVLGKLNIQTYLPGVSFNAFLIMLYSLILLIILVLIDIIYVSYSFSKKKFKFTWPLVILAQLVPLFVTILFLPITETLLSVVQCESKAGTDYQVMMSFPEVPCWKGWHLFHSAITLLFSSLFVMISSIVALALFEPRMTSNKLTARQNSRGQVIFIMNKIICQLVFSFNPFEGEWVYCVMLFLLSGWLYWTYNMNDPFYNKKVSKFFRIVSSYYFWTNTMLLVSQILSFVDFNGALTIWISGLPFIGIIIVFELQSNTNELFTSNLKFKSGRELESHLRYLLQLIQNQDNDENSSILVKGYVEKHQKICTENDCPLKMARKKPKNMTSQEYLNEQLLKKLEKMYKIGIKKYPNCTQLHISFAFFNLERLKNKNKAYEEFSYALSTDPTFEEEFIVYRFKKIIRENLEDNNEDSTDLIEIIRFENHILLCEEAMITAAQLYKEFWTELKEEGPDLAKLNDYGSKITRTTSIVNENYQEIAKINGSVPEVLFAYSIYLILIINDKIEGTRLLQFSKKENSRLNKKEIEPEDASESEGLRDDHPIIVVEASPGSNGKIVNANLSFTELAGYQKEEIVERNIEKLLPEILWEAHREKINEYLESEQYERAYINRNNKGYIRSKSGYILPVQYKVQYKPALEMFIVSLKSSNPFRNCCHIMTDSAGVILDVSILVKEYFGLEKKWLEANPTTLAEFNIKDIQSLYSKYSNNWFQHEVVLRAFEETHNQAHQYNIKIELMTIELSKMQIDQEEEESQLMSKECRELGYCLQLYSKWDSSDEDDGNLLNLQTSLLQLQTRSQRNNGSLYQECESTLQSSESLPDKEIRIMSLYDEPNMIDIMASNLALTKTKPETYEPYQLNTKIKTMRLINNELKMVYEGSNQNDCDPSDKPVEEPDDYDMVKFGDQNYYNKIRKAINTKLNHIETKRLALVSYFVYFALVGINVYQMDHSINLYEGLISDYQDYFYKIRESNYLSVYMTATLDVNDPKSNQQLIQEISHHSVQLNSQRKVSIELSNGEKQTKSLEDSFEYIQSLLVEYFQSQRNRNITYLYRNYVESIRPALEQENPQTQQFINELLVMSFKQYSWNFAPILLIFMFWLYTKLKIDEKKLNILLWFLDIPISYVNFLRENCDSYLKNFISIKEMTKKRTNIEDNIQFKQYVQNSENKEQLMQQQQKVRKSLIVKERKKNFCSKLNRKHIKMAWTIFFLAIFEIAIFIQTLKVHNTIKLFSEQWEATGKQIIEANYIQFSELMLNNNIETVGGTDLKKVKQEGIEFFKNSITEENLISFNLELIESSADQELQEILSAYKSVYFTSICRYLQTDSDQCENLVGSSLAGGYRAFMMSMITNMQLYSQQFRIANQKYSSTALLRLMELWNRTLVRYLSSAIEICEIIFYVYSFGGVLMFLIGWALYLMKLNDEVNAAIKMLNMIPLKLLSKSRKQTRQFIIWIIREANKKLHSDQ